MQGEFIVKMIRAEGDSKVNETYAPYYLRCTGGGPEWSFSLNEATSFSYQVAKSVALTFKRLNERCITIDEDRFNYFVVQSYEEKV